MTELIFNGIFSELNPAQCVALLSCFMCDEKSNTQIQMTDELSGSLRRMQVGTYEQTKVEFFKPKRSTNVFIAKPQELARMIARISKECHIDVDEDVYVDRFKPFLMDVCYAWCNGCTFMDVCRKTDIFEGTFIKCLIALSVIISYHYYVNYSFCR